MTSRRAFLLSAATLGLACKRREDPPPVDPRAGLDVRTVALAAPFSAEARFTIVAPRATKAPLPVLVALHGMGETSSPERGARGWPELYALDHAYARLAAPPLEAADYRGLVRKERLAAVHAQLAERPFQGLMVVCPWVPAEVGSTIPYAAYISWLTDAVLPRVAQETNARSDRVGIDGVSFGGIGAIRMGLERADVFAAVGALQPAIREADVDALGGAIEKGRAGRPFRLVTSTEDYFRAAIEALHAKLEARGVPHEYLLTEGPHDYLWNQGPGAIEMLLWHDRVLRS
jgi:acetyl esterase/lipase